MASIVNQFLLNISGETFDVTEAPSTDSSYVQGQVADIASGLVLSKLNDDLRDMGRLTRIALHCAVVKGDSKLGRNIQEFGVRLATLCDDSAIAIGGFQRMSTTVVETLHTGYYCLIEGLEDLALDGFEDVEDMAGKVEVICEELHLKFQQEGERLKNLRDEWAIEVCEEEKKMTRLFKEGEEQTEIAVKRRLQLSHTIDEKLQQRDKAVAAIDVVAATRNCLFSIAVTVLQIERFWNRLRVITKDLQSNRVRKCVKRTLEHTNAETSVRMWTSKGFKTEMIANSAKWVSCCVLWDEYMKGIKTTQTELYSCLKELILPSEAPEKLEVLLKCLQQQIRKDITSGE